MPNSFAHVLSDTNLFMINPRLCSLIEKWVSLAFGEHGLLVSGMLPNWR